MISKRATRIFKPNRRHVLAALSAGLLAGMAAPALAAEDFGIVGDSPGDQSEKLQLALNAARAAGQSLQLPAGTILAAGLDFPGGLTVLGVPGRTLLRSPVNQPVGRAGGAKSLVLSDVGFAGPGIDPREALIAITNGASVTLQRCWFDASGGSGIVVDGAEASIVDCRFSNMADAAIHALDSLDLDVRGNRIADCGNGGIRIWRSAPGHDGSIVSGNHIARIDWRDGGNGQNGNGINLFKADDVVVADNVISDCAFSAIRANTTRNALIRGNSCVNSGEVAIFSEFAFSGSVIADNVIDGAAAGISITNLDSGGHLATCTGNVVRNIAAGSKVNPDTRPVGIYVEADTVVNGNAIESVPGVGIAAGYGPYLRNVVVSANVVRDADIGVGVSVVQDASTGLVLVSGNVIANAVRGGIAGLEWEKLVSGDLTKDATRYPNVTIEGNSVS